MQPIQSELTIELLTAESQIAIFRWKGPAVRNNSKEFGCFHDDLLGAIKAGRILVGLDVCELTALDSYFIGTVVSSYTEIDSAGGELVLIAPVISRASKLFSLFKSNTVMTVVESLEECLD